jgi:hypothetical protein
MNKLTMFVLAPVAAATVAMGALAAAPSGSAGTAKRLPGRASLPQVLPGHRVREQPVCWTAEVGNRTYSFCL